MEHYASESHTDGCTGLKVSILFSLNVYTTDFFFFLQGMTRESELIYWLEDLVAEPLLPLVEASKGSQLEGKKRLTHSYLFCSSVCILSTLCIRVFLHSFLWENILGLWLLQLYNWLGGEWPDLNEACEVRPHLFLLIDILQHVLQSTFASHWEAMQCGSLVLGLNFIFQKISEFFFPYHSSLVPNFHLLTNVM